MVRVERRITLDYRVCERLGEEVHSVFRDKGLLSVSYVPGVLVGRGREEEFFARILVLGVRDGFLPPLVRVYGGPGCGKTVVVRGYWRDLRVFGGMFSGISM